MNPVKDLSKRFRIIAQTIFEYYGLTASLFADKINVQRSSISHLLSGRNKPSLDFILKVIENFPEASVTVVALLDCTETPVSGTLSALAVTMPVIVFTCAKEQMADRKNGSRKNNFLIIVNFKSEKFSIAFDL